MREEQIMSGKKLVTVREGTRMPQSFKYAWRWLMAASAAAMLIATIPAVASAQTNGTPPEITLCVGRDGFVHAVNLQCRPHQIQLTWNIQGPVGEPGEQGIQGPQGVTGPAGEVGPQGAVGNAGLPGPAGAKGAPGPTGPQGPTGAVGLIGNTGPDGIQGPQGIQGTPGTNGTNGENGDNITTLTGGTLGDQLGEDAGIQLTADTGDTSFLFMGPGNGASFVQTSVQVPTPGGEAFDLQVNLDDEPGAGASYTFVVCNEATCDESPDGVSCIIANGATTCFDDTDETFFNPGDTLSIEAFNSSDDPSTVDVGWSLDYGIGFLPAI
jgi:Collagen triple helix repeat (20 copies)